MAKVESKKVTTKPATKKTTKIVPKKNPTSKKKNTNTKKAPKKVAPQINEINKVIEVEKKVIEEQSKVEKIECRFCHEDFDAGLTICPFCRRKQGDRTGIIVITILAIVLLIAIVANHFIEKYYEEQISESDYKYNCVLASYEQLIRSPKELKDSDVKVIGKIVSVDGSDLGQGNLMLVKMDANLFEGAGTQIVEFEYLDSVYEVGFLEGDIVTIYGKYTSINGNVPFIKAKYIVFGT